MTADTRIVFTGCGIISAAGLCRQTFVPGATALTPIEAFDARGLTATHAGEVNRFEPLALVSPLQARSLDRGTLFAIAAATQALQEAALDNGYDDVGVAIGTSGSMQFQNTPITPQRRLDVNRRSALYVARSTPLFQAEVLAHRFGLGGPRLAFGCVSVGGLLALGHARDLLIAGHADAMVVGGGEIHTLLNTLGMDALGISCSGPCSPFELSHGMCFGEGAACFVIERLATAQARGATILGELGPVAASCDARKDWAYDPAGRGVARVVQGALQRSGSTPRAVGWVRSTRSGLRGMDRAEALGLQTVFGASMPPVCSTETLFGHVNGVSPLLGVAAILWAFEHHQPPTALHQEMNAPGGKAVPLPAGVLPAGDCLLSALAFGGLNAAAVIRGPDAPALDVAAPKPLIADVSTLDANAAAHTACADVTRVRDLAGTSTEQILLAGMGAVSALGPGVRSLTAGEATHHRDNPLARRVNDRWLTPLPAGYASKRDDRLTRMALCAAEEALQDAGVRPSGQHIGLLLGVARSPMLAGEHFVQSALLNQTGVRLGRQMLRAGAFSVACDVSACFGIEGYVGVMSTGVYGGTQLLAHGAELLRADSTLEGLLVLAVDEWTPALAAGYQHLRVAGSRAGHLVAVGEGAAAIYLQRASRRPQNGVCISGVSFAGQARRADPADAVYRKTIARALQRASIHGGQVGVACGQPYGRYDEVTKAHNAILAHCPEAAMSVALPDTGLAESAGGLFSAIVATQTLRRCHQQHALIVSANERGAHAAILLSFLPEACAPE